ncbi:MAG: hypothetical protein Q9209_002952 [Squamulea sp. 1 TL-2023]
MDRSNAFRPTNTQLQVGTDPVVQEANLKADLVKSFAHWGSSKITGRGLFAIAGNGSIAQLVLDAGEDYIAHPRYTLFLQFHGPATILLQTRAVRLNDVLTNHDVNEIAEAPGGSVAKSLSLAADASNVEVPKQADTKPLQMSTASIGPDGKIIFEKDKKPLEANQKT